MWAFWATEDRVAQILSCHTVCVFCLVASCSRFALLTAPPYLLPPYSFQPRLAQCGNMPFQYRWIFDRLSLFVNF
jgi:hypothetical protein